MSFPVLVILLTSLCILAWIAYGSTEAEPFAFTGFMAGIFAFWGWLVIVIFSLSNWAEEAECRKQSDKLQVKTKFVEYSIFNVACYAEQNGKWEEILVDSEK